jgi:hypothetical protein
LQAEKSVKLSKEQTDMKSFFRITIVVYTVKQKLLILVNANWPVRSSPRTSSAVTARSAGTEGVPT